MEVEAGLAHRRHPRIARPAPAGPPVRPGDRLPTTGEITRIDERGNMDVVNVTTTTVTQHGRTVIRGVWTAVVRR